MIMSLGKILGTAGTPHDLMENLSYLRDKKTKCNSIFIQVLSTNAGKIYIGLKNMDKTTLKGVWAVLPVPTANSLPAMRFDISVCPNPYTIQEFYFDVDNTGEGICGNYQYA